MQSKYQRSLHWASTLVVLTLVAACSGTAVVTLTATASPDRFLAYRVGLQSVELVSTDGSSSINVLPEPTTVDLAKLTEVSEVLAAAAVAKADYKSIVVTLDYGSAQIVYDDGSVNGLALTPVAADGNALGQTAVTLTLDPSAKLSIASGSMSRLALDFHLGASDVVNAAQQLVTVTPLIVASAAAIDSKPVRIRGPLQNVDVATARFTTGVEPFDFPTLGAGQLTLVPNTATTYEINGAASTGSAGFAELAALAAGAMTESYGTLTSGTTSSSTANGTATLANLTYTASQVLAGASVQSASFDRVAGVVAARSGNTLTIEDATLLYGDGGNTFVAAAITVNVGANTLVTTFGQGGSEPNSIAQISVGARVQAVGAATTPLSGNLTLDASAGLVKLETTTAYGLVTSGGTGLLRLSLTSLGGRSPGVYDFVGTGASTAVQASATDYVVDTGSLDLSNATAGAPVEISGFTAAFAAGPPDFIARTLSDPATIVAELVVDWGAGTAAPFTTYDASAMSLDALNANIGARHVIQVGSQAIDVTGLASNPLLTPSSTDTALQFSIGHSVSGTVDTFNTYAAFIAALHSELTGSTVATGMTANGQYTVTTFGFAASSITVILAD